jgi:hypothetical protein
MSRTTVTTLILAALGLAAIAPSTARADHRDRIYDRIELFAKVGADQARDLYKDIVRQVDEPGLRAQMMDEARRAMVGFAQIRAMAKQERVERMGGDIREVHASLERLDRLVHELEYSAGNRWGSFRREPANVEHMHRVVLSLTDRIVIIDDMAQQVYGPPVYRYETYTRSRPGFDAQPNGVYVGGRGFQVELGSR